MSDKSVYRCSLWLASSPDLLQLSMMGPRAPEWVPQTCRSLFLAETTQCTFSPETERQRERSCNQLTHLLLHDPCRQSLYCKWYSTLIFLPQRRTRIHKIKLKVMDYLSIFRDLFPSPLFLLIPALTPSAFPAQYLLLSISPFPYSLPVLPRLMSDTISLHLPLLAPFH